MRILIVEDDADKAQEIKDFTCSVVADAIVDEARSFHSALKAICNRSIRYEALLLDMSMPNFDISANEPSGGAQENFAGRDLLMQMKMRNRKIPTIVVTMFDGFGEGAGRVSIHDLGAQMSDSFGDFYIGHVYYNQAQDAWKEELAVLLNGISE